MGDERAVSSMHKDPYENLFYVASGEKVFTLCPPADARFLYEQDFHSGVFDSGAKNNQHVPSNSFFPSQKPQWTVRTGYEDQKDDDNDNNNADDGIVLNALTAAAGVGTTDPIRETQPKSPLQQQVEEEEANRPAYVRWIEADVAALQDPHCEMAQHMQFPLLKYAHPIHNVTVRAGELLYLPSLWFHRVTQTRETIGINYWYNMNFNSPHWCYFQLLQQLSLTAHASPPTVSTGNTSSGKGGGGKVSSSPHYLEEKKEKERRTKR